MRAKIYLNIAVIGATILTLALLGPAAAGPPENPGNPGLPGCLSQVSELENIVANQQETIDQQAERIEELEDLLQNFIPVPQTGQKTSYYPGDDGDLQKGVQWPDPRFTDNGDGTVTDHLTGLIWLKNANCFGYKNWWDALNASNNLGDGQCGLSDGSSPGDWRMPNLRELHSLIDYSNRIPALPSGHPFVGVQYSIYWSSTGYTNISVRAWIVTFSHGGVFDYAKGHDHLYMWPVRGGND